MSYFAGHLGGILVSAITNSSVHNFEKNGPQKALITLWTIRLLLLIPLVTTIISIAIATQPLIIFLYLLPLILFNLPSFIFSFINKMVAVFRLTEIFSYIIMMTLLIGMLIIIILDELLRKQTFIKHSIDPLNEPSLIVSYIVAAICITLSFFFTIQYLIKTTGKMYGFYTLVKRPKILGKDEDTMFGLIKHKRRFSSVAYWKGIINFLLYILLPSLTIWTYLVIL